MFSRATTVAVAAAALATAVLSACGGRPPAAARDRPPPLVSVARVEARDVPVEVRAPVDLRPLDPGRRRLEDARLPGRRARRPRRPRDASGQLLALVRPSDLPDQLAAARSTLAQAQSSAALARTNYDRAKVLAPDAVVSQQELQQAQTPDRTTRRRRSRRRESQIAALAVRLGETRITSPLTGVVVQRRLDPGALVGPPGGGAIVTVARVDVLRVFITVNERELAGVARRQGRARRGRRAARAVVRGQGRPRRPDAGPGDAHAGRRGAARQPQRRALPGHVRPRRHRRRRAPAHAGGAGRARWC